MFGRTYEMRIEEGLAGPLFKVLASSWSAALRLAQHAAALWFSSQASNRKHFLRH